MAKPSKLAPWSFAIAFAVIVLDQISKWAILQRVFPSACPGFNPTPYPDTPCSQAVLPFFDLTMVWNRGVSFGLFRSPQGEETIRWALAVFAAAVAIGLSAWAWRIEKRLTAVAVGLIIGGALGNLVDRIRYGAVADFLNFEALYFPWVFNIADSGISIGVALLLYESFFLSGRPKSAA